jgi:excisionase family DNA binding protein
MKPEAALFANGSKQVEERQTPTRLPDPLPRFLTVAEVALLLRVSKRTVYDWVSQRKIPHRKAGDRTIFDRDELLEWTRRGE